MLSSLLAMKKTMAAGAILALGLATSNPATAGGCVLSAGVMTAEVLTQAYPHIGGTLTQIGWVEFNGSLCLGQTGIFFEANGSTNPIFFQATGCSNTLHAAVPINGADWNLVATMTQPPYGPSACQAALALY